MKEGVEGRRSDLAFPLWIRSLWETPLPDFIGPIFDYFFENWSSRRYVYTIKADIKRNIPRKEIIDESYGDDLFDKIDINDHDLSTYKSYTECLTDKRSRDFPTWIIVCWCLKNISAGYEGGDPPFLELWISFSKKCFDKYNKDKCLDTWYKTIPRKNGYNIGSLKMWAKEDNIEKYKEISNNNSDIISETIKKKIIDGIRKLFHHPLQKLIVLRLKSMTPIKLYSLIYTHLFIR